ncbi:MAG: thioredoxin family protein [Euryarchaeota archaeon]|nr:thioredoxin family protein [Euryarchaeota archaeon]
MALKIEIFAMGCARCHQLEAATHAALDELGLDTGVDRLQNLEEAKRRGITSQPALFINGKLMVQGRIPSIVEIKDMINQQRGLITDPSVF